MPRPHPDSAAPAPWELEAEAVAVKIRWFGLVVGYLHANAASAGDPLLLNGILTVGLAFTTLDTLYLRRGRVFLGTAPVFITGMEALFIALLCYSDGGLESPFRFYYLLSVICAAVRYPPAVTAITCGLDALSVGVLYAALPPARRDPSAVVLLLVVLLWVTWAAAALARLLKRAGEHLTALNAGLEDRIAERTRELQESQAQVLHQEKMAAFGLLAAGIAHEVGNPLTSISSLVQLLQRRDQDAYTRERLGLVSSELTRIQAILRELVTFSRPASDTRGRVCLGAVAREALGIAKFYKGMKTRAVTAEIPDDLPPLVGVRDQLVQAVFNLVINAIDATGRGGRVRVRVRAEPGRVAVEVADDGLGIGPAESEKLFRPYFTTKRHGTGLGLFVTRKLVAAHGGTVAFDSRPGAGTTFRLTFPVPQTHYTPDPSPPVAAGGLAAD